MNRSFPLLLICALVLTACSDPGPAASCDHNLPERGWRPPPYPGAQPDQTDGGALEGTRGFKTADPPATVLAFYAEALTKQGWQIDQTRTPTSRNERIFGIANCC